MGLGGAIIDGSKIMASNSIPLNIIDDSETGSGNTKDPGTTVYITQDENVLLLPAFDEDLTLELYDASSMLVYTIFVPAGSTQVVLPATLSGTFELRFVADTYYYYGYISL